MTVAQMLLIVLNVSIAMVVLGLGLGASLNDAAYLVRRPGALLRSVFSMHIVMPVVAVVLVIAFGMRGPIGVALLALSLSPMPPFLPLTQTRGGGTHAYAISLLVITALLAVAVVPLGLMAISVVAGAKADAPEIAGTLALTVTLPLVTGMVVHDLYPGLARRLVKPISTLGLVLLVLAFIPVAVFEWGRMWSMVGNGVLVALVIFAVVGIAVGHFLGGPTSADRLVLATATAARHPGIAIAVAAANSEQVTLVAAVVIWHLLVGAVMAMPYTRWMHLLPTPEPQQRADKTPRHFPPIR